jgi:hypothetical protein
LQYQGDDDDGMELQVAALPPAVTSRFGEVVFAQGGTGYSWWPSLIFDPRLTVEPARSQARKHLGTRHLVYFFQCVDAPFSVLPFKQIKPWIEGLAEDLHLGRAAKSHGKQRYKAFREAVELACLEMDKPADERLDWEHSSTDPTAPALQQQQQQQQDTNKNSPASQRLSSKVLSPPPPQKSPCSPSSVKQQQRRIAATAAETAVEVERRNKRRKKQTRPLPTVEATPTRVRQMGSAFRQQSTTTATTCLSDPIITGGSRCRRRRRSEPEEEPTKMWTVVRRKRSDATTTTL